MQERFYEVTEHEAGFTVLVTDDGGERWFNFHAPGMNRSGACIAVNRYLQEGFEPFYPKCECGHAASSHNITGRTQDIDIGRNGGAYACRYCECPSYLNSAEAR